jgi:hypothetical protein
VDHLENIYSSGDGLFLFDNVALPKTLPDVSEAFIFVPDGRSKKVAPMPYELNENHKALFSSFLEFSLNLYGGQWHFVPHLGRFPGPFYQRWEGWRGAAECHVKAGGVCDLGRDAAAGGEEVVPVEPACADDPRAQAAAPGRGPPERALGCAEGRGLAGVDGDEARVDAVELRVREEVRLRDTGGRAWTRRATASTSSCSQRARRQMRGTRAR